MTMILVPQSRELLEIPKRKLRAAPAHQKCGVLVSRPYDGGPEQQADLIQCVHCQRAFVYHRGSGRLRGFCTNCNGITCGSRSCDVCVPAQQMLDNMGAGMEYREARQHRPIKASVPCKVPKSKGGVLLGKG